jgi:hypothetical protein
LDNVYLCQCIYDSVLQEELIVAWINTFLTEFPNLNEEQKILELKRILKFYSAIFKHESYSEEKEWRFICFPITFPQNKNVNVKYNLQFLAKRGLISQFIQMDYMNTTEPGNWPFENIYLGSNVENSDSEVMNFIQFCGNHCVKYIKKSKLEMRLK